MGGVVGRLGGLGAWVAWVFCGGCQRAVICLAQAIELKLLSLFRCEVFSTCTNN